MKTYLPIAIVAFGLSSLNAQIVTGFSENFNDNDPAGTALANLKQFNGDPTDLSWTSNGGTGGTGGATLSTTLPFSYYRTGSGTTESNFDMSAMAVGDKYTTSVDLRLSNETTAQTLVNFGFTANNSSAPFSAGNSLSGSLIRAASNYTLRMRNGETSVNPLSFNQSSLTNDNWYRVTLELTKSSTSGEFGYGVTLFSLGSDGLSAPTIFNDGTQDIAISGTTSSTTIYSTTTAQWVIDARPTGDNGIYTLDNFSTELTAVPEPSSVALLIGGGLMLMVAGARGRFRRNRI